MEDFSKYLTEEPKQEAQNGSAPNWFEGHVLNPFTNAIGIEPYNAVANAVNFVGRGEVMGKQAALPVAESDFLSPDWLTQNMASGLGMIVPYAVAGKVAGVGMRGAGTHLGASGRTAALLNSEIAAQVTGAAILDFSRDTHGSETRMGNAAGGALAFYVFGKGNSMTLTDSFWRRQGARAGIGSLAGTAHITASSLVSGEGLPSLDQVTQAAVTGGTMNIALPPTQRALGKVFGSGSDPSPEPANPFDSRLPKWMAPVESAYYSAKWKVRDGYTDARRSTYAFLNAHDLRHPVDRLRTSLWGPHDDVTRLPRAPLTAENNPVTAFERDLPEYYRRIAEKETALEGTPDRKAQNEMYDAMKGIRQGFALQLLNLWHGTSERPGIKSYTDQELATGQISAERVGQIREALGQSNKNNYPNATELSQALAKLAGVEPPSGGYNDHYALNEISLAKEQFYNYNENALFKRMAMPAMHHYKDHAYGTPMDWMPFEPTAQLPNLFHGTVSQGLPSLFLERAVLPASELRLRGIQQKTGESATEEFPRRSISITRDFNEAWAYHRHSPEYLTGFPVVLGISRDIVPRMRSAGMLEPGELLVDKLQLGSSWFGLRRPDVTHLYVPDAEVSTVAQQIAARRIRGLSVVGLSELRPPQWKPDPVPDEFGRF